MANIFPSIRTNVWHTPRGLAFSAEYQTVYDSFTTKPSSAVATAQNTMVESWVTSGFWGSRDIVYIMANNIVANSHLNWITPASYTLVPNNSPTFTANEGYAGNGSNAFLDTLFNLSTDSVNASQDDSSLGLYSRTSGIINDMEIGRTDGSNYIGMKVMYTGTTFGGYLNDGSLGALNIVTNTAQGMFCINRKAGANYQVFMNGVSEGTITKASTGLVNAALYILSNGVAGQYTTRQLSMVHYGASLSDAAQLSAYNAFQTYMTTLGKQV